MFFVLSKTVSFMAMPLVLICILLGLSVILKNVKWKKRLLLTGLSFLLFFSNDFIANEAMLMWEIPPTPYNQMTKKYDYGILLTGVTSNDLLPDDRVYFSRGADRVVQTINLYKRGIINTIVISGGTGRLFTEARREADDLFKAMVMMGVDSSAMIIENESRNTYESAENLKRIIGSDANKSILLITSAFHMRRSKACFDKTGMEVEVFTTDFYTHPRYFSPDVLLVPKVEAINIWHKLFKEWAGMAAYWAAGYI